MVTVLTQAACGTASKSAVAADVARILSELGVPSELYTEGSLFARSPIDGSRIGKLRSADLASTEQVLQRAQQAADVWARVAPGRRGEFVRRIGDKLREVHEPLMQLVMLELGVTQEDARREVTFARLCCDKAFSSAREIGQSMMRTESERLWLTETWQPLGVTGCISPFNRPLTQFAAMGFLSLVCGNAVVWKPSERAPLCALALQTLILDVARASTDVPPGLVGIVFGGPDVGKTVTEDFRIRYLDAATSISAGRLINTKIAQNFMRGALSLGGSNATIVCSSADLAAAANSVIASVTLFGGQHAMCTRRVLVHQTVYDCFVNKLKKLFPRLPVGDPRLPGSMMGPLIDRHAFERLQRVLMAAASMGAKVMGGTRMDVPEHPGGYYVRPALVELPRQEDLMLREHLAPILFVAPFKKLSEAFAMDAASEAGMTSAIFTRNMGEVDEFARVTRCGMLNINALHAAHEMGFAPVGAGASNGGRESSTISWKALMQRCIVTMNMSEHTTAPDMLGMLERGEI